MQKLLTVLTAVLVSASSAAFANQSFYLDDSASFVLAKSAKLGLGEDDIFSAPTIGGAHKVEADKHAATKCAKDADCAADQYCTMGMCKDLCARNTTKKKVKCSGETPVCTADNHDSYCACNDESCGPALSCKKVGSRYSCEPCGAGEKCGCPDGKMSNGAGKCVTCISNNDCADNEVCTNPKTEAAACTVLTCPTGQYVANHQCNSCAEAITGCQACTSKTNCTSCEKKYQNPANNGGQCVMKTCGDGQYLNEEDGECYPCSNGCTKCTSATNCQSCQPAYTLISGAYCELNTCADGQYLNMADGQCYSCPAACTMCSTVMTSEEVSACTACVDDYKLNGTQCVLKSCSEMGYATSCGGNQNAVPANKSGSDGACYSCAQKSCSELGYSTSCAAGYSSSPAGASGSDGACVTCSPISGYCTSNSQCADNQKCVSNSCTDVVCPACQTAGNHTCVAVSGCCTSNSQCGANQKCVNNGCVAKSCAEINSGYKTSCSAGYTANSTGVSGSDGACVTCSAISGYCTSDSQCGANQKCVNNSCVLKSCSEINSGYRTSCGAGYDPVSTGVSGSDGACVTCSPISGYCTSNSQCADNQKCVNNRCVLKSCAEMGHQTNCNASEGYTAVSANVSGSDGACYDCNITACPSGYSTSTTSCSGGYTLDTNGKSGGRACGKCVKTGCTSDSDCGNSQYCSNYACTPVSCGTCQTASNHTCVAISGCCTSDSQCANNQQCSGNQCVTVPCDTSNGYTISNHNCVATACPSGYSTSTTSCSGGYTLSTNGKSGGRACGKCEKTGCTSDSDCASDKKCSGNSCVAVPCDTSNGYTISNHNCVATACPSGYSTSTTSCKNGTLETSGKSGGRTCGKCVANSGTCESKGSQYHTYGPQMVCTPPIEVYVDGLRCYKCGSGGSSSSSSCSKCSPSSDGTYTSGTIRFFGSTAAKNAWTSSGGCCSHVSSTTVASGNKCVISNGILVGGSCTRN